MCNHYKAGDDPEAFKIALRKVDAAFRDLAMWTAAPEGWPKRPMPVIYQRGGARELVTMRWGIWPSHVKDKARFVTNSRDDKLTSFTWRKSVDLRRCLIPANSYLEPGPAGSRRELMFSIPERSVFFIAGIWDTDPDGSGNQGFSMVTTRPNATVQPYHDRMPVLLDDAAAAAWIGETALPASSVQAICAPFRSQLRLDERDVLPRAIKKSDLQPDQDLLL